MQSVDFFANLSVGKKLLLGFAMVLLLTLGVAGTGFYAVDSILNRSYQMNQLLRINAAILEARGLERDFALTRSDESAAALRSTLAKLNQELDELAQSSSEEDQQKLQQIRSDAAVYADNFTQYGELISKGVALRERMADAAQKSREEFEYIELDMYDAVRVLRLEGDHLKGSDPLTIAEAASGLTKRILDLRTFESMFIAHSAQAAVDSWNESYADVTTIGSSLKTWLNDEQKATMDGALNALAAYQQAFGRAHRARASDGGPGSAHPGYGRSGIGGCDRGHAGAAPQCLHVARNHQRSGRGNWAGGRDGDLPHDRRTAALHRTAGAARGRGRPDPVAEGDPSRRTRPAAESDVRHD